MDLKKLASDDLYGYLGVPVKLELNVKDEPICGNVYTIDPITHSVVLMQFDSLTSESPKKLIWVPGTSIKLMHELSDEEIELGCIACSSKSIEIVEKFIAESMSSTEPTENEAVIDERLKNLLDFLTSKHVPYEITDDKVVQVGPVKISRPYRKESLASANALALQRTQKMLAELLP